MPEWPAHVVVMGTAHGFELVCRHCHTAQTIFVPDGLPLATLSSYAQQFATAHEHADATG